MPGRKISSAIRSLCRKSPSGLPVVALILRIAPRMSNSKSRSFLLQRHAKQLRVAKLVTSVPDKQLRVKLDLLTDPSTWLKDTRLTGDSFPLAIRLLRVAYRTYSSNHLTLTQAAERQFRSTKILSSEKKVSKSSNKVLEVSSLPPTLLRAKNSLTPLINETNPHLAR